MTAFNIFIGITLLLFWLPVYLWWRDYRKKFGRNAKFNTVKIHCEGMLEENGQIPYLWELREVEAKYVRIYKGGRRDVRWPGALIRQERFNNLLILEGFQKKEKISTTFLNINKREEHFQLNSVEHSPIGDAYGPLTQVKADQIRTSKDLLPLIPVGLSNYYVTIQYIPNNIEAIMMNEKIILSSPKVFARTLAKRIVIAAIIASLSTYGLLEFRHYLLERNKIYKSF